MALPFELNFISHHFESAISKYSIASWLLSDFDAPVWKYSFGFTEPKSINWKVPLYNGETLTDSKHEKLLNSLKHFLIISVRSTTTQSHLNGNKTLARAFDKGTHIIDYLLLNAENYRLLEFGLEALTSDDLKAILTKFASHHKIAESIYDWTERVKSLCTKLLNSTNSIEIANILTSFPNISAPPEEDEETPSLGFPDDYLFKVRAALKHHNLYIENPKYGNTISTLKISNIIYSGTIRAFSEQKPAIIDLCFPSDGDYFHSEFPSAPFRKENTLVMSKVTYSQYRSAIYSLGILHKLGLPAPATSELAKIANFEPITRTPGRYSTLPSEVALGSLRNAITFHIDNGKEIVDSYLRALLKSNQLKVTPYQLTQAEFMACISPKLIRLGVTDLSFSSPIRRTKRLTKETYYKKLRANQGLLELLFIYIGCVQIVTGILSPRRISELYELPSDGYLDETEGWLIFKNRKSTRSLFGCRATEARPIEPVAVEMMAQLQRMHRILRRKKIIKSVLPLFSSPAIMSPETFTKTINFSFTRNLRLFCDYFETKLNKNNERNYIHQHQLRRFFALMFFNCSSFGGLETLQWMMGHTDISHIWNYITESTPGEVLRGTKAQFIAENLSQFGPENYLELASLLKDRYGTSDFALVDSQELASYIEELLENETIQVEPDFFTDATGNHLRVVVIVNHG